MALINQAFRLGLSAAKTGAILQLKTAVGGTKVASNAMLNAIVKGSADQASRGDQEYLIENKALLTVEVNEPRLIGTAAIGGAIYGMLVLRFYKKLQLANRLALASEILSGVRASIKTIESRMKLAVATGQDIAKGMSVVEYDMKLRVLTTQNALIQTERRTMDAYVLMLEGLNDTSVEQIVRQNNLPPTTQKQLNAVKYLIESSSVKGLTKQELGTLKQLFDPKDALGMKATLNGLASYLDVMDTAVRNSQAVESSASQLLKPGRIPSSATIAAMGMKVTGVESYNVSKAAMALQDGGLDKRLATIATASDDLAIASKGSFVGRVVGKALLVDSVIWAVTLGIDIGMNLFLTEEEQSSIPYIGFLFSGAGWSPLGAIIEGIIDYFVAPDTQQTLFDVFLATMVAATEIELLEDAIMLILNFYIDNVSGELLVPLEFGREIDAASTIPLSKLDPLLILEGFTYLCVAKVVYGAWIRPSMGFLARQVGWTTTA